MSDFVLDASIALSWVLDNPVPQYALDVREQMLTGKRGLVPALWHLEVANGLTMAERRGDLDAADVMDALEQIGLTARSRLDIESKVISTEEALKSARAFRLTASDAVYLGLSVETGLALATLDKSLRSAAIKAGVSLLK